MDIIKISLLIIGALLIVLIGVFINNKYKKKYEIIQQIIYITYQIEIDILFSKKNIFEIIKPLLVNLDSELQTVLLNYIDTNIMNFELLTENENQEINNYFNSLGECSADIEISKTTSFKERMQLTKDKYKQLLFKNGQLAFKLSVCASLVFIIMFA